ncbi:MAG: PAS domain-containing protein [Acidimicrobiia bacterium]|nr:PAS domain-containing protein [Acidimicrobiia bacterium]
MTGRDGTATDERLHALLLHSFDVMLLIGNDGKLSYVSPSANRLFGYDPETLVGTDGLDFVHPDDLHVASKTLAGLLDEHAATGTAVVRARHADGSWRWVEAVNVNLLDDPGVRAIVVSLRDITERKRAEDALRESEARFRAVVQNSLDVTGLLDAEGRIVWMSPTVTQMLGHDPAAIEGRPVFEFVHPDDLDSALGRLDEVVAGRGPAVPITVRVRRADDQWHPVEAAGAPLVGDHGDVEGVILNVRDVAWRVEAQRALEQSEERFKALVRYAPGVLEIFDEQGVLTWVSPSASDLFGTRPRRSSVGLQRSSAIPTTSRRPPTHSARSATIRRAASASRSGSGARTASPGGSTVRSRTASTIPPSRGWSATSATSPSGSRPSSGCSTARPSSAGSRSPRRSGSSRPTSRRTRCG